MVHDNASQLAEPNAGHSDTKKEPRVFLNERQEGTFICPACNKGVIRDLSRFSGIESAVRLKCKCSCGHVYRVLVERRAHFRKSVNLLGRYFYKRGDGVHKRGLIRVRDISQSGLLFAVNSEPEFKTGDTLTVEFTLDDRDRSEIREEGIVKRIQANMVGIAFQTTDHYGKLGHYLFR
ncbi:PilZ domain-containing protein [Desulfosarcina ovata]|uniref:PilZ domain-containing protein n=1 Tax=Desulfosarcina ovata subsp. ovata TaxID=2752305 RepID=A0A5K8AK90_9BACT|nr:PilZ domain-containing protein [Desulfosarcina ovata]BBO93008.1 hypothetical protein DSCOOX_61880 [Desulfosarcina ovata subsp. ovata]